MKKFLSVLLSAVLLFSLAVPSFAAEDELVVTVANDLHYNQAYSTATQMKVKNNISTDYPQITSTGRLLYASKAIILSFFEQAAASDSDFVLLPGDLADNGIAVEHEAVADIIGNFEASTGKQVYVVPGNHDYLKTSVEQFKNYYADFGYGDALAVDTLSASYTVDLDDEYRLLAIDSCQPPVGSHGINAERLAWIKAQCDQAAADGKKLIAMMHHNLLDHYNISSIVHVGASVNADINMADVLAQGAVKYIFTGHTHNNDIQSYTAANGATIYDVVTGSLNVYPCEYREVRFGEKVKITTKDVEKIDTSIVAPNLSERATELMASNFPQYALECFEVGMEITFRAYTSTTELKKLLKLDAEKNPEMCAIFDKIADKLYTAFSMPIYKAQETEEGMSLESIVAQYGKTLPASEYTTFFDLAVEIYRAFVNGDENYPSYSTVTTLATRGLAAVLSYTLADVSAEEYATVLDFVLELFGVDVSFNLLNYAGSSLKRFEGAELLLTTALNPLITGFTVDGEPGDRNVTLPGYTSLVEPELTFLQKIINFFLKISDFFRSLVSFRF